MRRLMIIFVIGCTALGLGLGLMLNSSSPGSSKDTAARSDEPTTTSTTARVLGAQVNRQTPPTTTATPVTVPVVVPTTTATTRPAVTTTTRAVQPAARPTTATTRKPAPAKKPTADCGTGGATANVAGKYNADDALWHVTVTVDSQNTKAIVLDKLVAHVEYADGTVRDITVPNAAGTKIDSGKQAAFEITDSSGTSALTKASIATGGFVRSSPAMSRQPE